jgi:hypothetical protein
MYAIPVPCYPYRGNPENDPLENDLIFLIARDELLNLLRECDVGTGFDMLS